MHDLGGMQCFGRVATDGSDEVFHDRWEAHLFAMSLLLPAQAVYNINEFRAARERLAPEELLVGGYYDRWAGAIETLLVDKGVLSASDIERAAGDLMAGGLRGPPPLDGPALPELERTVLTAIREGVPSTRAPSSAPRFAAGDPVRAANIHPAGHTRLPRYARGHPGTVTRMHGWFVLPDTSAQDLPERAEPLYTVRFAARELWGPAAAERDSVCLDLWESYLDDAVATGGDAGARCR
ncbi:MAG: nitrile hydratase subunit beta [Acidimicrobiales bacterium]